MIDLDDSTKQLPFGVLEYTTLRAFSVTTIRNLLLFDVDILNYQDDYNPDVRDNIAVWQELLRKYIDYDKLVAAGAEHKLSNISPNIHEALSAAGISESDASLLSTKGFETIGAFIDADLSTMFDTTGADDDTRSRISAIHNKLNPPMVPRRTSPVVTTRRGRRHRSSRHDIPEEKALSPEDFILEQVSVLGLNPTEMSVLEELDVQTVENFLDLDLTRALDLPGNQEQAIARLTPWQKLYRKRLGWKRTR